MLNDNLAEHRQFLGLRKMIKPQSVMAYSLTENLTSCNRTLFSLSMCISF